MSTDPRNFPGVRGRDFYTTDKVLRASLAAALTESEMERAEPLLEEMGRLSGGPIDAQAEYSDRYARPRLESHDRGGNITNFVRYNPLYEESARSVYRLGIVGCNYGDGSLPYLVHFALGYLLSQSDPALYCPVTLTASVAKLIADRGDELLRSRFLPGLTAWRVGGYLDAATAVTEVFGGSDVGANECAAHREESGAWRIAGEKWFVSNVDADVLLVSARPEGAPAGTDGLALFIVPRWREDGSRNGMRIRRLKDKLGTTGLATGEIEFIDAAAYLVTPPGEGIHALMSTLEMSRLANAWASAGIMRRVLSESLAYARARHAFGKPVISYPMVQDELLGMQRDLEASLALLFEATLEYDRVEREGHREESAYMRMLVALSKFRTGQLAVHCASQGVEMLGGNGYVEDFVTARMYREAQVLPVWEGTSNIQSIEILRTLSPKRRADVPFRARVKRAIDNAARHPALSASASAVAAGLADVDRALEYATANRGEGERIAKRLANLLADVMQSALLLDEAAAGLASDDARKSLVTRLWLEKTFTPPALRGISSEGTWRHVHFAPLVDGERIPPAPNL